MCDITDEVTVRLGLGQGALEDSRERAIRGLIVGKVPSNLRCLGPRTELLALLPLSRFCLPAMLLSDHVFVFQQLSLGANPNLPTRYVLSSLWVLNQNTQHGPTRSI